MHVDRADSFRNVCHQLLMTNVPDEGLNIEHTVQPFAVMIEATIVIETVRFFDL